MTLEEAGLPAGPFFKGFKHGDNDVIDSVPRKVLSWDGDRVTVGARAARCTSTLRREGAIQL